HHSLTCPSCFFILIGPPPRSPLFPYTTLFRSKLDTSVVPVGGAASTKIKHVFFILHENKTFDSVLGTLSSHFGPYAGTESNVLRSEEHTSELQSLTNLVCRLLLEKKKQRTRHA